jgi:enoyl-CoA hydratase/carnithine racemase
MIHFHQRVSLHVEQGKAVVTLTRGEKHNGIDPGMLRGMLAAQRALAKQRDVRAVVVRGEGSSFCAGIDARSFLATTWTSVRFLSQLLWPVRNWFQAWSMGWRQLGVPVIAAIHGNCFGAGLQLALGADIRFATPDARLSIMEARLGLVPDMGGPTLLRELVPLDIAKELTLSGRIISGQQAHELGLVTHVADDPYARAFELAEELSRRSPDALASGKFLLQRAWSATESTSLALERRYQRRIIGRANQRRALQSAQRRDGSEPTFAPRVIRD